MGCGKGVVSTLPTETDGGISPQQPACSLDTPGRGLRQDSFRDGQGVCLAQAAELPPMPGKGVGARVCAGLFRWVCGASVAEAIPLPGLRDGHEDASRGVLQPFPDICGGDPQPSIPAITKRPVAPGAVPQAARPLDEGSEAAGLCLLR